jgi:hypothetical protein
MHAPVIPIMPTAHTLARRFSAASLAVLLALGAAPARAVIIQTASGTGNTTAPGDDPGWNNVSIRGNGTAVYLGNGWVLTANDTTGGSMTFNGQTFSEVPGTAFSLTNNGAVGKTANTDLKMFQINGIPTGVATLPIATTTPTVGTAVTMIGGGRDRGAFTQWSVNQTTNPWTWTEVSSGGSAAGYQALAARSLRWGTNAVAGTEQWISTGSQDVLTTWTRFEFADGTSEAQAVEGDFGGPVFVKNGGQWQLAGIMVAVAGYSGQPSPELTAVFGNDTFMADLSYYRSQIVAVVPEPSAVTLVGMALAGGAAWATIRRRIRP